MEESLGELNIYIKKIFLYLKQIRCFIFLFATDKKHINIHNYEDMKN
jgi:hypothetical protein